MKYIIFLIALLLIPLIFAETTFFDQDDAFIMENFPAIPTTGQVTNGGGCRYEWDCTNWSECLSSGKQIRNCTNIGTCSDKYKTPEIEQNCTYTAPKSWEEKENETGGVYTSPESKNKNKIFTYFIIILIIIFIIFYLKKDYFKKLIKR